MIGRRMANLIELVLEGRAVEAHLLQPYINSDLLAYDELTSFRESAGTSLIKYILRGAQQDTPQGKALVTHGWNFSFPALNRADSSLPDNVLTACSSSKSMVYHFLM